ncbi:MAG: DUF72 domain-containing protein [Candidatus Methanoperedens sp.]|nr:DUF72 domain-containing protein [Candidatus Methanoperedens sp.]MCZ7370913.1 DUF72 domain-containing protein [Candidatus Methanoperedens sp.]
MKEKLHIGTMGWSYDFWTGSFYPENTSAGDLLHEYAKVFNTVEIDSTFYRIPYAETVKKWNMQTPKDFTFSAKFPRVITHDKMLKDCEREMEVFIEHMSLLEDKLGPMLMQFPAGFKPDQFDILKEFLSILPAGYRYALEVRNKKWLEEKFYDLLRDHGVALVWIDASSMPRIDTLTADFTYIRWEGDRKTINGMLGEVEKDRKSDISLWAERIRRLTGESIEVFGYFSKYYSGFPPEDARMLQSFLAV